MLNKNEKYFEIVLVDIELSLKKENIICIKKNLYDIKYCTISYRWGEYNKQSIETPDYIAWVSSFKIYDLLFLLDYIKNKLNIFYLWIDGICINQNDYETKKVNIYKIPEIFSNSIKIIGVPDLYKSYILENINNLKYYNFLKENKLLFMKIFSDRNFYNKIITFIELKEYGEPIEEIKEYLPIELLTYSLKIYENSDIVSKTIKWYRHIIEVWFERTWVVSERIFGIKNNNMITYSLLLSEVIDLNNIFQFKWDYIEDNNINILMSILNTKSSKYEDKFYSILPHTKYINHVKNIYKWELNNIKDIILKLLNIFDLDDKISYLLNFSSNHETNEFLPSFLPDKNYSNIKYYTDYKNKKNKKNYVNDIKLINNCLHIKTEYYDIVPENEWNFSYYKSIDGDKIKLDHDETILLRLYIANGDFITIKGNIEKNKWIIIKTIHRGLLDDYVDLGFDGNCIPSVDESTIKKKYIKNFIIY